jgi:hypothetical protein
MEETVVEGEEPGKHALVKPDKAGGDLLRSAPLIYRLLEVCSKGGDIGTKKRDDGKDADNDTRRLVDEHHRGGVSDPEDGKYDGDKICEDER